MFLTGRVNPVNFGREGDLLLFLQRIRDEAHRFAREYHRNLRSKRIRESLLDDIQGVGPSKKRALLAEFGSVRRLARAPEDKIASVSGRGYKLA